MPIWEDGKPTHEENVDRFKYLLNLYLTKEDILQKPLPTGNSITEELDYALGQVAEAVAANQNPQQAVDNAWVVFYDTFPSGH